MMTTDGTQYSLSGASVLFETQLHVLAPDGVVPRECRMALEDAEHIYATARANARLLEQKANEDALVIRQKAKVDGQDWLDSKERELSTKLSLQQIQWLAQLQPVWLQALERTLRQLCGGLLRPEVLAGAIDAGIKEFKDLSELRIDVNPDDLIAARAALMQLTQAANLVRIDSDNSVALGSCRFRNATFEVTLDIDRAIDLALDSL
jgi:Flagellar assembly protein FliH